MGNNVETGKIGWIDITIENAADLGEACARIAVGPKAMGGGRFCVIEDSSGAVAALYQPPPEPAA